MVFPLLHIGLFVSMHDRTGYTLAYVSRLPQGLRGEEILDGGGGKRKEVSISSLYLLFAFLFSFPPETPYNQARYTLLSSKV